MTKIHDITKPYPWPDAEVKYVDAPETSFESSALEENWLNAKANAQGRQVFKYILLPTGEYECHVSAFLYRVKQVQFEIFADHFDLDPKHDFMLLMKGLSRMGIYKADNGDYYFHLMDVDGNVCMGTRSAAITKWINGHLDWIFYYEHDWLMCQENPQTKPMSVTMAYAQWLGKSSDVQELK